VFLANDFFFDAESCTRRALQMRIKEKELSYAFHPAFDPDSSITRRFAYVAVQRRLGILS
jgi:hypothetical protein